jgi:hypothetical protein
MYGKKENISAMVLHNLTGKLLDEVQAHTDAERNAAAIHETSIDCFSLIR